MRTLFEKIWDDHLIEPLGEGVGLVQVDRVFLHERTGGVALKSLEAAGRAPALPRHVFCTMDHVVDTRPGRTDVTVMPTGTDFIRATREAANAAGLTLFDIGDPRQGIVHVISPEQGIVLPGLTLVCPDSHTCTQGAFGALAWGIGSTEAEHAVATSTLRVKKPRTMRVEVAGRLAEGVTAKDLALAIIARHTARGGLGYVVEYAGSAIEAMDLEARMTLCNLAVEFSAFTAIIAPDDKVFDYLKGRPYAPTGPSWDDAVAYWRSLPSDAGATYDAVLSFDASEVSPMVTWGSSPQQACGLDAPVPAYEDLGDRDTREGYDRALAYMGLTAGQPLEGLPIDAAFIGSCTNSRISDLRRAAALLRGRTVAPNVRAICVPGSSAVKRQAEAEGLDQVFKAAGFEWREAGCSMCFFAGGESFGPQERVITSTNRNFESRQGPQTRSHLASPETVAASAVAGRIADPRRLA
ncbi:MAG: 3-isopropylmalate dehydratase large subunit [Phenylobacterium sp.]|nr:3-isopropylmalate dehydratase large subunit [Phenylobacterium sp.]